MGAQLLQAGSAKASKGNLPISPSLAAICSAQPTADAFLCQQQQPPQRPFPSRPAKGGHCKAPPLSPGRPPARMSVSRQRKEVGTGASGRGEQAAGPGGASALAPRPPLPPDDPNPELTTFEPGQGTRTRKKKKVPRTADILGNLGPAPSHALFPLAPLPPH